MGKKNKSQAASGAPEGGAGAAASGLPFLAGGASVDQTVASLFEKSAGPVRTPSVPTTSVSSRRKDEDVEDQEDEEEEEKSGEDDDDEVMEDAGSDAEAETAEAPTRKRKRAAAEDLEDSYMRRLAKEEQKATEKRRAEKEKRQKVEDDEQGSSNESKDGDDDDDEESAEESTSEDDEEDSKKPALVHESHTGGDAESQEIEKSNRTVFLGNVASKAITSHSAKKTLIKHLESFLSALPESSGPHKVESLRFRSTAFASGGKIPKRASFARREVLDETTPSTNAYAVYSTVQAARKAPAALNGTVVLDRHLRVDNIAHPAPTDHKRCIFVGNLDFVDQASDPEGEEKKKKKNTAPADVEEGLWRTFNAETGKSTATKNPRGTVESVRVVRDAATRVGKGFAYVQFHDQNCVEEALLLDGKKFPPMLPRKLRVSRARKVLKKREAPSNDRIADTRKTLQGRAGRLLGKAGQAQIKARDRGSVAQNSAVFEGVRATEGSHVKLKAKSRGSASKAKKNNRSKQRAAAYKAAGGKNKK